MAMGTRRRRQRQERLWISHQELAKGPGHPFYKRVNELLESERFDEFAEKECARFYAENHGRPSVTPGIYFRLLLVGYFEGIDSERGIAWRAADSFGLRQFLGIAIDEHTPDHSTISRTRRLIDVETHRKVFFWILELLRDQGLLKGKTVGIDATTLEANAAMRSIVRRDSGESYEEFLKGLAKKSGIETPTRKDLARFDRQRKNKASNKDWVNPHDRDARITKMKDGRTHLAHKAEHAVDSFRNQTRPNRNASGDRRRSLRRGPRPLKRNAREDSKGREFVEDPTKRAKRVRRCVLLHPNLRGFTESMQAL